MSSEADEKEVPPLEDPAWKLAWKVFQKHPRFMYVPHASPRKDSAVAGQDDTGYEGETCMHILVVHSTPEAQDVLLNLLDHAEQTFRGDSQKMELLLLSQVIAKALLMGVGYC